MFDQTFKLTFQCLLRWDVSKKSNDDIIENPEIPSGQGVC